MLVITVLKAPSPPFIPSQKVAFLVLPFFKRNETPPFPSLRVKVRVRVRVRVRVKVRIRIRVRVRVRVRVRFRVRVRIRVRVRVRVRVVIDSGERLGVLDITGDSFLFSQALLLPSSPPPPLYSPVMLSP